MVSHDHRVSEGPEELRRTVEVVHLHVCGADRLGPVGIGTRAAGERELASEVGGPRVQARERGLGVEHLDGVDRAGRTLLPERVFLQRTAHRVEGVRYVDDTALLPDAAHGLLRRETMGDPLAKEEPDDLATRGANFLAHHDATPEPALDRLERASHSVVVGDAEHVDAAALDSLGELVECGHRVTRIAGVHVAVDAYLSGGRRFDEVRMQFNSGIGHGDRGYPPVAGRLRPTSLLPMRAVEAVIFDYGGVFSSPLFQGLDAFEDAMGYPPGSLATLLFGDRVYINGGGGDPFDGAREQTRSVADFHRLERGEITFDDYLAGLMRRAPDVLGKPIDLEAYQRFTSEMPFGVHWPVVHHARRLRADGLILAMLTNNIQEFGHVWRATLPIDELFAVVVDSSSVGMRKPEPEIYVHTCEQVGVEPDAAVFVDDNADNCAAAAALGIEAVHFTDPWEMVADLEEVLERRGTALR